MGRRGPAPLPSKILQARGSWRGKKNKSEPEPEPGVPPCPAWLSQRGRAVWDEMCGQLAELGVLTTIDANALARYCDALVRFKAAAEFLDKNGETYVIREKGAKGKDGKVKEGKVRCVMPWPQVSIYSKLAQLLARLEQEFGLTPSSRSRVQVPEKPRPSPAARAPGEPIMKIAGA